MNKERRARVAVIADSLDAAIQDLETVKEEEQEAFDNIPESLQCTERAEESQNCIDVLEELTNDLLDIRARTEF